MATYYPISEDAARRAKQANSWSDYRDGSATAEYRSMVDAAVEIAEAQKARVDPEYHEKIDSLLDAYCRRLAANINRGNEIDASCPSVMIAGASNFPVRKKEKQNTARAKNVQEYNEIKGLLDRIQSVGMGGIMSDDKDAIAKLRAKLEKHEALQDQMKSVNAYYRKHGSLDGCPDLPADEWARIEAGMQRHGVPFPGWALANNNATIRRVRDRIKTLEAEAAQMAEAREPVAGDGYELRENTEIMRVQFIFDFKPDDDTRALLKQHGFRWAPSQGAWQRLLNDNGRRAAREVIRLLQGVA